MSRVLLLATTTGYQTRSFGDAAERLGVQLVVATDRCQVLDDPWRDRAVRSAAEAIGLHHGPIHAECRVNEAGVLVLEVAARPIGGLCARSLQFTYGSRILNLETTSNHESETETP